MGGEGFEPPKAHANGFTVRPGSPTPASAQNNAKIKTISISNLNMLKNKVDTHTNVLNTVFNNDLEIKQKAIMNALTNMHKANNNKN